MRGEPDPDHRNSNRSLATPSCRSRQSRALSFLNEPSEAESICLDILAVDASNQALIILLLALTDQFGESADAHERARDTLALLESEYDKAYYAGIIAERRAKAQLARARGIERRRVRLDCRSHALLRTGRVAAPVGQ